MIRLRLFLRRWGPTVAAVVSIGLVAAGVVVFFVDPAALGTAPVVAGLVLLVVLLVLLAARWARLLLDPVGDAVDEVRERFRTRRPRPELPAPGAVVGMWARWLGVGLAAAALYTAAAPETRAGVGGFGVTAVLAVVLVALVHHGLLQCVRPGPDGTTADALADVAADRRETAGRALGRDRGGVAVADAALLARTEVSPSTVGLLLPRYRLVLAEWVLPRPADRFELVRRELLAQLDALEHELRRGRDDSVVARRFIDLKDDIDGFLDRQATSGERAARRSPPPSPRVGVLLPGRAVRTLLDAADVHGLVVDTIWPQLEAVMPTRVRRTSRRQDATVALLRATSAAAGTVALGVVALWALVPPHRFSAAALLLAVLVAVFSVVAARQRVAAAYRLRADAVGLYRFDLVAALHLPQPRGQDEWVVLSEILMHGPDRSTRYEAPGPVPLSPAQPAGSPETVTGVELDELRAELSRELPGRVAAEVAYLLDRERADRESSPRPVEIDDETLRRVASAVADRALPQLAAQLDRDVDKVARELRSGIASSLDESLTGPPLQNFVGYFVLEHQHDEERGAASGDRAGEVAGVAGSWVRFRLSLLPDENARSAAPDREGEDGAFMAIQPVVITSGQTRRSAEFELITDSPTLTVEPYRSTLATGSGSRGEQRTVAARLPTEPGRHELWFQLFQSGRLIEVISVGVRGSQAGESSASMTPT